jgi:hypothetical protein
VLAGEIAVRGASLQSKILAVSSGRRMFDASEVRHMLGLLPLAFR